jgi:hypothetical protein
MWSHTSLGAVLGAPVMDRFNEDVDNVVGEDDGASSSLNSMRSEISCEGGNRAN